MGGDTLVNTLFITLDDGIEERKDFISYSEDRGPFEKCDNVLRSKTLNRR